MIGNKERSVHIQEHDDDDDAMHKKNIHDNARNND